MLCLSIRAVITSSSILLLTLSTAGHVYADSMSALISQKSNQLGLIARLPPSQVTVPSAKISTRSTIQRATAYRSMPVNNQPTSSAYYSSTSYSNSMPSQVYSDNTQPRNGVAFKTSYRYPDVQRRSPTVLPAFLSKNYDNIDSEYLPLLSRAEMQSSLAARDVISTARTMALNERTIIQGGCWDYLNAVFKRAGVTRDTVHKGAYKQGPYANSSEIEVGDWLYYINHGYNDIEHSGLFVGWVDESAKQALILSYAGESRREPARYRVYDLSHVYQIMRPVT